MPEPEDLPCRLILRAAGSLSRGGRAEPERRTDQTPARKTSALFFGGRPRGLPLKELCVGCLSHNGIMRGAFSFCSAPGEEKGDDP